MNGKKTLVRNFTEGNIPRQLFMFMIPFMASNAFQVLYSAVDMIIVGKYVGKAGLSSVSMCGQILNFLTMVCTGLSSGGQVLIAQMIGANKKEELNRVIGTLFTFILLLSVLFAGAILTLREPIFVLLHMPDESYGMAVDYMTICGIGMVFSFGYNMVSAVLRGMGDSRHPFLFITIASVLNLILDLVFTGYMGLGVAGAAAATMLGQAVSFVFGLIFLYRRREQFGFDFKWKNWRLVPTYVRTIAAQGIPLAISSSAVYFSMFYVNSLINRLGLVASATFGVGIKLDDVCNKISQGIRYAAAPMISQNYAAKNLKRVKHIVYWSWLYGAVFHGAFMLFYILFGKYAFALFTSDAEVLELAPVFIRAVIWTFIPMAFLRGSNAFVQGIGNARLSMIFGMLDGVICRIGLSVFFGTVMGWGFAGFVFGYGLAPFGALIPGMIYFFSGIWKKRKSLVEKLEEEKKEK